MSPRKRSMPSGALSRSLKLAGLAGKLWKGEVGRVLSGIAEPEKGKALLKARLEQAALFADTLGGLKGAAMKFGQILALEARDLLPDEVVKVLERLQSSASSMPFEEVCEILRSELGGRFEEIHSLSREPIAAASIGQVHSAFVRERKVAIKVQYPGVALSLDSDLRILHNIAKAALLVGGRPDIDFSPVVAELRDVFGQETDYLKEASLLGRYRDFSKNIEWIRVPDHFEEFSSQRVLTLSFEPGVTVSEAVRSGAIPLELRRFYADCFLQLYNRELCEWGLVQTDPNLGNFFLQPERRTLVLLDFGACREFSMNFRVEYARLILGAFAQDRDQCRVSAQNLGLIDSREVEDAWVEFVDLVIYSMSPFRSGCYDFSGDEYSTKMRGMSRAFSLRLRYSPPPRNILFLHRKLGGIFQIIRRLNVSLDLKPYLEPYRALVESAPQLAQSAQPKGIRVS